MATDSVLRFQVGLHTDQLKDHETRIKKLELDHVKLFMFATLGSGIGAAIASFIASRVF